MRQKNKWIKNFSVSFFLAQFLFVSGVTRAEKKTDPDVRVVNPYILKKTNSNQGNLGICYTHSTAQVFEGIYEEFNQKEIEISPLFLSFHVATQGYKTKTRYKRFEIKNKDLFGKLNGGWYKNTFKDVQSMPLCPKKCVEDFLFSFSKQSNIKKTLESAIEFLTSYEESKKQNKQFNLEEEVSEKNLSYIESKKLYNYLEKFGFKYKGGSFKSSHKKTLYSFFIHNCNQENRVSKIEKLPHYRVKSYYSNSFSNQILFKKLRKYFNEKRTTPLAISYSINNLFDDDPNNGSHSSFIYGMSRINGEEYYLVRNSWGGEGLKEGNVQIPEPNEKLKKEDIRGDFWMSTKHLEKVWKRDGAIHVIKFLRHSNN